MLVLSVLAPEAAIADQQVGPGGRWLVLPRSPGRPAPAVYGAAGKPLVLVFDAPVDRSAVRIPGAGVFMDPAQDDTLIVTPSKALATSPNGITFSVPLETGPVALKLVSRPDAPDLEVRIVHQEPSMVPRPPTPLAPLLVNELPIEIILMPPGQAATAEPARRCWLDVLVRTRDVPEGRALALVSEDQELCHRLERLSPKARARGGAGTP